MIFGSLFLLRRIIVNPIISFRNTASKVGKGNLDAKVDISSKDELGELASAFNQMTRDLKKSRSKIERYSKTLEKLLDQKDEFIGQLGHDLKNPLTPLVGLLPMITEQEKDPTIKEHLKVITTNVEYMRELIFKTLELAKLRSPDTKFDFENLNLSKVVDGVADNMALFLKDSKMKLVNKVKDKIMVWADPLRLSEVFNNLISNAVKYTEGAGMVTIDAEEGDEFVTISVSDTGIGMSQEQLNRVFDEFYMADKASSKVYGSSGLGLSIVKRVVEKHGGKIWVESLGVGKGSTFFFTIKVSNEKSN